METSEMTKLTLFHETVWQTVSACIQGNDWAKLLVHQTAAVAKWAESNSGLMSICCRRDDITRSVPVQDEHVSNKFRDSGHHASCKCAVCMCVHVCACVCVCVCVSWSSNPHRSTLSSCWTFTADFLPVTVHLHTGVTSCSSLHLKGLCLQTWLFKTDNLTTTPPFSPWRARCVQVCVHLCGCSSERSASWCSNPINSVKLPSIKMHHRAPKSHPSTFRP